MKRWFLLLMILALALSACQPLVMEDGPPPQPDAASVATVDAALANPDAILPLDPAIRYGVLDNGLTYYVRHNEEPANRAELRLAINAGSLQEDDDQKGLAHFLEHMMFNGTRRFAGQELVNFLESVGITFGPDLNAYTSFEETVYMLHMPTDDAEILATGFDVLEDWAAYATLDQAEIDKERGVVVEEWRLREQTASGRMRNQIFPVWLGGSRYDERMPIGDMDIVRNAPRDTVVRFYQQWYRPDLMAVVAVGDFDVDAVEQMIIERFSTLTNPADAPAHQEYSVPAHEDTRYLVATDPENTSTQVRLSYTQPAEPLETGAQYRELLVSRLFYSMLQSRLDEIGRKADAPFVGAYAGASGLVRPVELATFVAQVNDGSALAGLESIFTELERARRHGFTESELERAKTDLLRFYEQAYQERANTESSSLVDEYVTHFLEKATAPGIAFEYELVDKLLPGITLAEVNSVGDNLQGDANRSVIVTAPQKDDTPAPTADELAAVLADVLAADIAPYEDAVVEAELVGDLPAPAAIVSENEMAELGVTELVLENGVHVLLKPTDFKDDEVLMTATSPGGSSLVSDEDFPEADTIASIVSQSGVGEFDQTALIKLLTGKSVSVSPYIDELAEGFSGSASTKDLETMFQLIYLYATAPRADEDAFEAFRKDQRAQLENRSLSPNAALQDALIGALYGDTVRRGPFTVEIIDGLDLARGFEIYQDRFADMSDFTFIFAGSFDVEQIKALAQQYLGTLPAANRSETWQDVAPDLPSGVIQEEVKKGQDEQSISELIFYGDMAATPDNRMKIRAVETILDIMVRDTVREELGGAYASGTFSNVNEQPDQNYYFGVYFGSEPARARELIDAVFGEIEKLQTEGPTEENVTKFHEIQLNQREEQVATNGFWTAVLKFYVENPDEPMSDILVFDDRIRAVTAEDVQSAAQDYLQADQYIEVILYPEGFEAE
ncbi:MAG: insulinase family protein [Caldilineaceae bacterium]